MSVSVTIELFGVPRARAGLSEFATQAHTARDALTALVAAAPRLADLVQPSGRLAPQYLLSSDGNRFMSDLDEPLRAGDRLLLLSADPGG